ncbi:Ig-like domain-containing protein, partial [Sellimonas intestinalis]
MRRAKRITALAVAAAMVLSNVAYAAPDTNTTTTQQGAESLNSQSDASGGVKDQASDTKGNTSTSASQSKEQVKQNESSQSTDPGDQKQTDSKEDVVSQNQDQKKDEDSKETQKPSTEADSQKSETQNVDADKSEDTQEPSKEQEKVLYDITFDTPEKHGRVTDLDGKEVADGKTLKTDENGKAKFKVKPDAGYQVQAVYQMPDEQTPLKLVKDSYYEMQVEKNTTVKVVYQKIPASEEESDGEDDGETKKTDTNQNEVQTPTNEDETNKAAESTDKKATTQSDESDTTGGEPSAGDTNGGISALTISGKNVVYVGEDITLTSDESGGWQHQWEADSGYVTVKKNSDTKATVTGVKAGTATITHSWKTGIPIVGQKSHRETFTVTVVNKLVTSIEIQQDSKKVESLSLNTGDEATLKAVVKPDEATNKNVTWSSSAGDVVQVDNGKLTAVKAGEARITASASDGSGVKAEVKVTVTDVAVKEITVSGEVNQTVLEGGKIQLAVNFVPENATNKGLKWKSLNSDIATVDENGIVTGVRNGTATIQATSVVNPEAVATFSVLVEEIYMTEFTVVADRTTVTVGDTATVRAIIKPDEYPNKEVRWESMDPTVATVNENGVVTTKATGPVTIKGTSKADPNSSATVTILVEDVKAESVTISGYNQNYLTSGSTVTLTATVKPDAAANKTIVWSSSNTDIVTVDQNGKVTAKNQGTATVRALNEYTGLYDEVEIMVYNREPQTVKVHVWVTNQLKTTVNINLPSDGTPVTLTDVLPTYVSSDSEEYVYCGPVYIHNYPNGTGWESIKAQPKAVRLRYLNKNVQYSTSLDGQWNNLRNNNVNAQYELLYSGNEEDDTDVNVVVGDWPYTDGTTTNKILRIRIYNSETGKYDYDSGSMYYDNGSNGAYGKIKFNCDESRYEVAKITVEKYDSRYSDRPSSTTNVEEPVSVEFHKKEEYERYVVTATVQAKEFTVHYDSNGGSNDVPEDQKIKAINGNTVTVASSPQPTKAGYVFAGWSYGGKTYFGGEAFEMPASNVTFVANWIEASQAINYKVNDAAMGTVTRSYERVTSQTSIEDLQGSLATPKDGYHFVKWIDEKGQIVSKQQYFKPTTPEPATYTAVFAIKLNETDFEVSGLSNHVYDGENHKDVPVVTKKGSKDALEEGTDYTVSYDTENFVDVKTIT